MNDLKPSAWMLAYMPAAGTKHWQLRWDEKWKDGLPGTENKTPLYAIPSTHRVVSVELLEESEHLFRCAGLYEEADELRAIIDNTGDKGSGG